MRVAVIPTIREYPWGAPGHCMGVLVEALLKAGHQVLWFVAPIDQGHPEVSRLKTAGAQVVLLPELTGGHSRLRLVRARLGSLLGQAQTLEAQLAAFQPEHVFLNQGGTWCGIHTPFFEALQSYAGRYSLICHLNLPGPTLLGFLRERAHRLIAGAANVFFNSEWCHRLAEWQLAAAISNHRYFQVPVRFRFEAALPWPRNAVPRVAMVNRLDTHHKGIDLALAAVAQLREAGIKLQLSIYGSGPEEGYLRELARYFKLADEVEFKGHTDQIEAVWRNEELLLLPSRYEGLSVAMVEAMGFGRPVLRTPYGGAAEWIEDGVNGYLCPAAEVPLLCDTLKRALAGRSGWEQMGRQAHTRVKSALQPDPARVFLENLR